MLLPWNLANYLPSVLSLGHRSLGHKANVYKTRHPVIKPSDLVLCHRCLLGFDRIDDNQTELPELKCVWLWAGKSITHCNMLASMITHTKTTKLGLSGAEEVNLQCSLTGLCWQLTTHTIICLRASLSLSLSLSLFFWHKNTHLSFKNPATLMAP